MTPTLSVLSPALKRKLLLTILESRHGDLREENLNRQGRGHFHVSGRGHEGMAAFGLLLGSDDFACPYYRDRSFVLGRGVTTKQLALDYMAKRASSSRGRQMPCHFSFPDLHIWSVPTPTASQLLPACGMAWGMKLDGKQSLTITTVGDAATRQGDFFEAVAFAKERELPLLLVVEDNGYGISSPTRTSNPLALGVLNPEDWIVLDGWDVENIYATAQRTIAKIRKNSGPAFVWLRMERLSSHTSSDDQKIYRAAEELATLDERDPLKVFAAQLACEGVISPEEFARLDDETKERVRADYLEAEVAENPLSAELEENVLHAPPDLDQEIFKPGTYRMGDTINRTLREGLRCDPRRMIFGEDVEDPKGGVFTLTKNLSTDFPKQVFNSPLAESTILGVACGLASYGRHPVFELQFIDFIYPGWNQLVTNLATLRWRTFGRWTCPAVIYAPYGAYLPGGSLWHSQANESAIAHFPGLNIVVPSTPEDAAGLLWSAMHAEDPTLFLIPKHMLWAERQVKEAVSAVPIGHARIIAQGSDLTLVAWGNTVEKSLEAIAQLGAEASVESIDLRSIVPWDHETIEESVRKTGRLVIVQEDTENCSVGQMIISHLAGRPDVWIRMVAPPILVSKGNVMIGYSPIYEFAALPDTGRIVEAIRRTLKSSFAPRTVREANPAPNLPQAPQTGALPPPGLRSTDVAVQVPIMGEGIRSARIASLLKKPGDPVKLDEALCEVETDKAVYPIESSVVGIFKEWRVSLDETVEIGKEIAFVTVAAADGRAAPPPAPVVPRETRAPDEAAPPALAEPALSPAIVKRLGAVVPANLQIDARWQRVREARACAKAGGTDCTPSLIVAWCTARAITRHAAFRRLVRPDGSILERDNFDLGIAVALPGGRLATAAVHRANLTDWPAFVTAYNQAITETRSGGIEDELQASVNLTSLGGIGVEQATPIVVPPSMATLFIGKAHERMVNDEGTVHSTEVATLSLTFDHRVVNGVGAAAFLGDVRGEIENFILPQGGPALADPA